MSFLLFDWLVAALVVLLSCSLSRLSIGFGVSLIPRAHRARVLYRNGLLGPQTMAVFSDSWRRNRGSKVFLYPGHMPVYLLSIAGQRGNDGCSCSWARPFTQRHPVERVGRIAGSDDFLARTICRFICCSCDAIGKVVC